MAVASNSLNILFRVIRIMIVIIKCYQIISRAIYSGHRNIRRYLKNIVITRSMFSASTCILFYQKTNIKNRLFFFDTYMKLAYEATFYERNMLSKWYLKHGIKKCLLFSSVNITFLK